VQLSENLLEHGLIDAVVAPEDLRAVAMDVLEVVTSPREGLPDVGELPDEPLPDRAGVGLDHPFPADERPGVRRLLRTAANTSRRCRGPARGRSSRGCCWRWPSSAGALRGARPGTAGAGLDPAARSGRPARGAAAGCGWPPSSGCRSSPSSTRPGRRCPAEAEEGGLAGEIARCLADLVTLPRRRCACCSGRAAAAGRWRCCPADRVLCAQHGWLSPLPPEGASAILHRTTERAPEVAQAQGVRSLDLLRDGIVDRVVAEHPDAADEPDAFLRRLGRALEHELVVLLQQDDEERRAERFRRYRALGTGTR
jgi:acetyl-CoA carboxylase carboxyl transferase subunit beta